MVGLETAWKFVKEAAALKGKRGTGGNPKPEGAEQSNPSKEDLRKTICKILNKANFNTATFMDILKQRATHYKVDLTPRKATIKLMIQEELTKLGDEAEENKEDGDSKKEDSLKSLKRKKVARESASKGTEDVPKKSRKVLFDEESGKEFILCEYNRDADSYRSPWSNKYHPSLEDGPLPYTELRELEVEANDVFAVYRDQYYEGGVSLVYMWEDNSQGFVACFLIKKDGSKKAHGRRGYLQEGSWEAIHVIEVGLEDEGTAHYCLTSTDMLSLTTENKPSGTFNLSGSIRRQVSWHAWN